MGRLVGFGQLHYEPDDDGPVSEAVRRVRPGQARLLHNGFWLQDIHNFGRPRVRSHIHRCTRIGAHTIDLPVCVVGSQAQPVENKAVKIQGRVATLRS